MQRAYAFSMATPKPDDLCDEPLVAQAYRGAVVLLGPRGVALAMTVAAAERSAMVLTTAAQKARRRTR